MSLKDWIKVILSFIFSVIIGLVVFFPIEFLIEFFRPAETEDGHVVMPIGQILMSTFISFIISITVFILLLKLIYRKDISKNKKGSQVSS